MEGRFRKEKIVGIHPTGELGLTGVLFFRRFTMDEIVMKPTADDVRDAVAAFDDDDTKIIEDALRELFGQYPRNTEPAHVLLKVTTLNTLYSTQIRLYNPRYPTLLEVTKHIVDLHIDSYLELGDAEAVNRISKMEISPKAIRYNYSFATKYCSWHDQNAYPIYDNRVYLYLCHLMKHKCLDRFPQKDWYDYSKFKGMIEGFQKRYGLGSFSFKDIDKFLFQQGLMLFSRKGNKVTSPIEAEPGLAPVHSE
jgi:hypothetical protein